MKTLFIIALHLLGGCSGKTGTDKGLSSSVVSADTALRASTVHDTVTKVSADTIMASKDTFKARVDYKYVFGLDYESGSDISRKSNDYPIFWTKNELNWENIEIQISDAERRKLFKKMIGNEFFMNELPLCEKNFHVIDFNADGLNDLIYTGRHPMGGEIDNFAFFQNNGKYLELTLKLTGSIVEISRTNKSKPISFKVWEWPCCAVQENIIYEYQFYKGKDKKYCNNKLLNDSYSSSYGKFILNYAPNFYATKKMTYIKSTELPVDLKSKQQNFWVQKDKSVLITKPNMKDTTTCLSDYIPGNYNKSIIIAELPINTSGKILNVKQVGDFTYYFVLLDFNEPAKSSLYSINGIEVKNLLGWIESSAVVVEK